MPPDSHVYICTIQRWYSILKGEELDESAEEENSNEISWRPNPMMLLSGICKKYIYSDFQVR
jgi:type I restriction enzyme R subunit